jgi:hypothetical protein
MKSSGAILRTIGVLTLCGMALAARAAAVFDNFESYAVGSNMHGQGGWAGWAGDTNAGALVSSAFSFSPTRPVNITGASDLVHTFPGATSGQWVLSVMQYIPSTSTGTNYVAMLNTYRQPCGDAIVENAQGLFANPGLELRLLAARRGNRLKAELRTPNDTLPALSKHRL